MTFGLLGVRGNRSPFGASLLSHTTTVAGTAEVAGDVIGGDLDGVRIRELVVRDGDVVGDVHVLNPEPAGLVTPLIVRDPLIVPSS